MPRFDRLFPHLLKIWSFLIFGVLGTIVLNLISAGIAGGEWEPTATTKEFISSHVAWFVIPIVFLLLLTALSIFDKRNRIDDQLLRRARVKKVSDLRPGLKVENADVTIADYRPVTYLRRGTDQEAARALAACKGVIVIGRPLSGKTRTAWEQLRRSPGALVVIPLEDHPPEFRADGLRGRDVILFVDDLHLVAPTIDLNGWINRLENAEVRSLRVVCTARDGTDWARIEEHQAPLLQRLDPTCRIYTSRGIGKGHDITVEEGKQLAAMLNLGLSDKEFDQRFDGTPGSLTLDLTDMGARYEALRSEQLHGAHGNRLVDSLKLLHRGGQPRLREDIVRAVAETIRGKESLSNETWDVLRRRTEEQGFGVFDNGVFQTYRPYLENPQCVSYEPTATELAELLPLLQERKDFEGLFYLGAEVQEMNNLELANRAYQASADGGFGWAANNLGTMLMKEGKIAEAEVALKRAIDLRANLAHGNLLLLTTYTDRHQEAEDAFRAGAAKGLATASFGLGNHLAKQHGREADAEEAFREAIDRGEQHALLNLGNLIKNLPGRRAEARQLVQAAIDAGVNEAYNSLGAFLWEEGNRVAAEEAFHRAAGSGVVDSYFNLGEMLSEIPERWDDAERNYKIAVAAGIPDAHFKLGVLLAEQENRENEAVEHLGKAVELGQDDARHRLGMVLMRISGKEKEAEAALRDAIDSGDLLALNSLGVLFTSIEGMEAEAEVILNSAAVVAPDTANRNLGVLLARQAGRERQAEEAFLAAIVAGEVQANFDLGKLLLAVPDRGEDACRALHRAAAAGIEAAQSIIAEHCEPVST